MEIKYVGRYGGQSGKAPLIGRPKADIIGLNVSTGYILGHVALFTGNSEEWYGRKDSKVPPLMTAVVTSTTCWLISVSINGYLRELVNRPSVVFHISNRLIEALPPVLRLFDFCIKWKKAESGETIVLKNQAPTGELMVLLFGRLGVITADITTNTKKTTSSDYLWSSPVAKAESFRDLASVPEDATANKETDEDSQAIEPDFLLGKGALIGILFYLFLLQLYNFHFCYR